MWQEVNSATGLTDCVTDSTVLFIDIHHQGDLDSYTADGGNTVWSGPTQNQGELGGLLPTSPLSKIHWSPLWTSVTKHQSWHPHSFSSLCTTAQAGRGPRSPKTPQSSTLLEKPLTAETSNCTSDREANKPPPINSTHVEKKWKREERKKKIYSSFSRALVESITRKSLVTKERSFSPSVVDVSWHD